MSEPAVILHSHLFKNGGTTFDWILRRNFGDRFLDHRQGREMKEGGRRYLHRLLQSSPALCALSSHHLPWPVGKLRGRTLLATLFVREPLLRVKSVYEFERIQFASDSPGATYARSHDFNSYVRWRLRSDVGAVIRDYHVRCAAGVKPGNSVDMNRCLFRRACRYLLDTPLVGIVEAYDQSMVYFEHELTPYFPAIDLAYVPQNINPLAGQPEAPDPAEEMLSRLDTDVRAGLLAANAFDQKFYRRAMEIFVARISAVPDFPERLRDFRQRCAELRGSGAEAPLAG